MNKLKLTFLAAGLSTLLAGTTYANQVKLINGIPKNGPLKICYRTVIEQKGHKPELSKPIDATLNNKPITIKAKNNAPISGVVITSVNGHSLNGNDKFNEPQQCSLATDVHYRKGKLIISLSEGDNHHGKITCSAKGGTIYHKKPIKGT